MLWSDLTGRGKIIVAVIFLILVGSGVFLMVENSGPVPGPCPCNYHYGPVHLGG